MKKIIFKILLLLLLVNPVSAQYGYGQDWFGTFPGVWFDTPGVQYESESELIFASFTTPPTDARKVIINNMVVSLKNAGIWAKREAIWVMAAETQQAGQINWKSPGTYTLTLVNSPTFTADEGFTGNGTTMYINTGWNPSGSSLFTQNSANLSAYTRSTGTGSGALLGTAGANVNMVTFLPKYTDNNLYGRINNATGTLYSLAATDWQGSYSMNRTSSTAVEVYRNGSSLGSQSKTSDGRTTNNLYFLCFNNNGTPNLFTVKQISIVAVGGQLTGADMVAENTIFEAYMDALGKGIQ